jgi:ABC-type multidrug transport system fused ATPase/permease subunit
MQNSKQRTIKDEFSDCTVLTVAHRLKTILDCDRIAVLSDGRLKEVGRPGVIAIKPFSLSLMAGRLT